jgi:hypothetical protein
MSEEPYQPSRNFARRRSSSALGAFAAFSLTAFGALIVSYPFWRTRPRNRGDAGFNVARMAGADAGIPASGAMQVTPYSVRGPAMAVISSPAPMSAVQGSAGESLGMFQSANAPQVSAGGNSPAVNLIQAVASHRQFYAGIRDQNISKSAVVSRFFQEWRNNPSLAALSADFDHDHNVLNFARNAVKSPQFAAEVKQYITQPDFRAFVVQMALSSPKDVIDSWKQYAGKDNTVKDLTTTFLNTAGLSASMAQGLVDGSLDPQRAASQLMSSAPGMPAGIDLEKLQQQVNQQQAGQQQQ